jgi:hypothetical protein
VPDALSFAVTVVFVIEGDEKFANAVPPAEPASQENAPELDAPPFALLEEQNVEVSTVA